jgi:hypothetical protein
MEEERCQWCGLSVPPYVEAYVSPGQDETPEEPQVPGTPHPVDSRFERLWTSTVAVLLVVLILAAVWWVLVVPHGTYNPRIGHGCKPTIEYDCLPDNPYDYIRGP